MYKERSEEKRKAYLENIKKLNVSKLYYLDECGIDDNEIPMHGWSKKGERSLGEKNGYKKTRLSIIACQNLKKIIAPFCFEGSCSRDIFEVYLNKILIPNLKKGDILIMDNASFHKGGNIEQMLNEIGVTLLYLPPYSPDLNPIENSWFSIKHKIKKFIEFYKRDLYLAAQEAFRIATT